MGPLLFLIYINDIPNEVKSNVKFFADDTSLFTVVKDKNESANILNNGLQSISTWTYNWKMLFNPDSSKPAQEVLFSRKKKFKFIQPQASTMFRLKEYLIKNMQISYLMKNLISNIILIVLFQR